MRNLPADDVAELQHHGLRHDQTARQPEVSEHFLSIHLQTRADDHKSGQHVAGRHAGPLSGLSHHQRIRPVALVFRLRGLEREWNDRTHPSGVGDDVLTQERVPLVWHRRAADRPRRDRLLDLAELRLRQREDLAADLAAGGGEQPQQADVLGQMIADAPDGPHHRSQPQARRETGLDGGTSGSHRRERPGGPAEHRDEDPLFDRPQPFGVANHLVDPPRDLEPEGGRHRVLAMGSGRHGHVMGALGEIRHRGERLPDQPEKRAVRPAEREHIPRLHDVLRRRTPVHPTARLGACDPGQLPHQGHDHVGGAPHSLRHPGLVEQLQVRRLGDRPCGRLRNHSLLRLGERQRRFDIQPGLPSGAQLVQVANTRIRNATRSGIAVLHSATPRMCRFRAGRGPAVPRGTQPC